MKKYNYVLFAMVAFLASSCSKELESEIPYGQDVTVTAYSVEGDTKSTLIEGGTDVYWEPGDEIKLFAMNANSRLQTTINAPNKTASFSGNFPIIIGSSEGQSTSTTLWAIYPYRDDASFADGVITTVLPSEQTAREGSFAPGMNITIAKANSFDLGFYNVCGGVRFRLTREGVDKEGINKIVFTANGDESVAGKFKTTFDNGVPVVCEVLEGKDNIVLTLPGNENFETGKWYYICALPGTLSNGFTLRLETENYYAELSSTSSVTFRRSIFGQLDNFDEYLIFKKKGEPDEPGVVDLGLSVKWAACNLGASKIEEYGDFYQWAGSQDVSDTDIDLYIGNCPYHYGNSNTSGWTKYIPSGCESYWSGSGDPDNKTILDLVDDVAHVKLGGSWYMPTKEDFEELLNNCNVELATYKGVNGRKFTSKINGNSIFLPAAGSRIGKTLYNVGSVCSYWSSSLNKEVPYQAYELAFIADDAPVSSVSRYYGLSIRPVYWTSITGVSLNMTRLDLFTEKTFTLRAEISPANASKQSVFWSSSDPSVAMVDQNGKITAVSSGVADITVTTKDGGYTATCTVRVKNLNITEPEAVDLGLSVKWASINLGASCLEGTGYYFTWGGTYDVSNLDINLSWDNCPYHIGLNENIGWTKYILSNESTYWSGQGNPDNKVILEPEDDAAHVLLGNGWRMPTREEFQELIDNCDCAPMTLNDIHGMKFTSRKQGYTDKSIFLPLVGCRIDNKLYEFNDGGYYWSSSRTSYPLLASFCLLHSGSTPGVSHTFGSRSSGRTVRPVKK